MEQGAWRFARPRFFGRISLRSGAAHDAISIAQQRFGHPLDGLTPVQRAMIEVEVQTELMRNRYDPHAGALPVELAYADWFRHRSGVWNEYFSGYVQSSRTLTR